MKNWGIVLVLLVSFAAVAQDTSHSPQPRATLRKTINLSGTMSEDGRVLLRDSDSQVWTVSNPEALHGFAGQEVVIRGQLLPENHELRVVSVKPVRKEFVANRGDSAFRR